MSWSNDPNDWWEAEGQVVPARCTAKAVFFQADAWDEPQYLPRSAILEMDEIVSEISEKRFRIRVSGWLARKNKWISTLHE